MTHVAGLGLAIFATAALLTMLVIAATNAAVFPRLRPSTAPPLFPTSILIPARNEAAHIGATVQSLLAQDYPALHIAVLDDRSEDGTGKMATFAAAGALNFNLSCGQPLPEGWAGKNWACHQLAQAACGEVLIFTDADVRWQPGSVAAAVAALDAEGADLLSIWPTQITVSWVERLVVPLMALAIEAYLPIALVHRTPYPLAAAANGQCLVFRRSAYRQIGGHAAVRGDIVEDVRLAQNAKAAGLHLHMADAAGLLTCRMYCGGRETIDGYTKNILAGHGNRVGFLLLSTAFHWAVFLWPWFWLILGGRWSLPGWPWWPMALAAAGIAVRGVTAAATRQRTGDALLMPISVLLMTWIALRALYWRIRYGGVLWKGRILKGR